MTRARRARESRPAAKQDAALQSEAAPTPGAAFDARPSASASTFGAQAAAQSPREGASPLQMKARGGGRGGNVASTAQSAFQGSGGALPHRAKIESSLGADMSKVQAYTGPAASAACDALGAQAFTMGNKIAFRDSSPSVQLAAHEATHVVQQAQGVSLSGGMGKAGDRYEVQADAVAARVGRGEGASDMLAGGSTPPIQKSSGGAAVQCLGDPLDKPLAEDAEQPEHGETPGKQRRYSVDQYVEMWEAERGRPMTDAEKQTLARGCIGITAINLNAGNPPLNHSYGSFDQAKKVVDEWNDFIQAHKGETTAEGKKVGEYKAVLFAKLFWSNQDPDPEKRKLPDEEAFLPDPETGEVDMSEYKYRAQPSYINFDYGFWDEESQCFWHANHAQPGMKVYQSTKDKFSKGYIDFDRVIYCAAIAENYKPAAAAAAH